METLDPEITKLIPHRPPFLWVDKIIECNHDEITTSKYIEPNLDIFQGHYPDHPILPGVILCEAIFQSGALLIAKLSAKTDETLSSGVPVLTRIGGARFKRQILPGDTVEITVKLKEIVSSVAFMRGVLRKQDKTAVQIDFSCALISRE